MYLCTPYMIKSFGFRPSKTMNAMSTHDSVNAPQCPNASERFINSPD